MTGAHAGPPRGGVLRFRVWPPPSRHAAPSAPPPPFESTAGETRMLPRRTTMDAAAVAAGLRARRDLTRQRDIPATAIPALRGVPAPSQSLPMIPLTLPAVFYDALGGDERAARTCGHCKAPGRRDDTTWQYDAWLIWSCPACQAEPGWRSPSLPRVREVDDALIARARLATWRNGVRQRPDRTWAVTLPAGGRQRYIGSFAARADAEAVYGGFLAAFAEAAGRGAAA